MNRKACIKVELMQNYLRSEMGLTDLALESQLGLNLYKRISISDYEGK